MSDNRLRNARIAGAAFGAFHVWLLLLVLQDAAGGTAPGGMTTFAIAVCLAPIAAALLLWQDAPPEWTLVANLVLAVIYGVIAFGGGVLIALLLGGPDRGNGFGGSDLKHLPYIVIYVVLASAVLWTVLKANQSAA